MLTNSEFQRALQIAGDRQALGHSDVPRAKSKYSLKETGQDFVEMGGNIKDSWKQRYENMKASADLKNEGEQTSIKQGLQQGMQGAGMVVDTLGEAVMGVGKMFLTESQEQATADYVRNALISTGAADQLQRYQEFKGDLSEEERLDLNSFVELPLEMLMDRFGFKGVGKGKRLIGEGVDTVVETGQNLGAKVVDMTPGKIRNFIRKSDQTNGTNLANETADSLEKAFKTSFVEDTPGVLNKLDRLAVRTNRNTDGSRVTGDQLVRELAEYNVFPRVEGEVADFGDFFRYIDAKEKETGSAIDNLLSKKVEQTQLQSLKSDALETLRRDNNIGPDLVKTEAALERMFTSFEKRYGSTLTPKQVNEVRKQMNRRTGAASKEEFELDAEWAVGNATRNKIDTITNSPAVREANAELAKLYRLRETANVFHNRKIKSNELLDSVGSWVGTMASAAMGLSIAGPGGLVIAGAAARLGSKYLANLLRRYRFGDKTQEMIIDGIKKDPFLVRKLIDEADMEDKAFLERLLLPGPSGKTPIEVGGKGSTRLDESNIKVSPAKKDTGRNPKTGKFMRIFTSENAKKGGTGALAVGGTYYGLSEDSEGVLSLAPIAAVGLTSGGRRLAIKELKRNLKRVQDAAQKTSSKNVEKRLIDEANRIKQEIRKLQQETQ